SCSGSCVFTATVSQGTHPISSAEFPGTVNFAVGGQTVHSARVNSSPATISFTYNVAVSGSQGVTAQVIDSVLYDSSDSRTVSFSASSSSLSLTQAKFNNAGPNGTKFSWSGGSGSVSIYRKSDNGLICASGGSSCNGAGTVGMQVYARDSDGNESPAFTITN
ncbi:MAG TPA: hypothetical protein VD947_00660, partial [Patescibacteria group bacterium]|nr:hypothetical protein [Patescibacteria group bacterium]